MVILKQKEITQNNGIVFPKMHIHKLVSSEKGFPKTPTDCYIQEFSDGRYAVMSASGRDESFYRVYTPDQLHAKFQEN